MNIILLNMSNFSEWKSGVVNRNFFIFDQLRQSPKVKKILAIDFLPINAPKPFGLKRALKYYYQNILRRRSGEKIFSDLTSVCLQIEPKVYTYSSVDLFLRPNIFWFKLNRFLEQFLVDDRKVLWLYNPFLTEAFEKLPADLKVFDMVDNWSKHASYQQCKNFLEDGYQKIKNNADIIFVVAHQLVNFYRGLPDVHWIPNGVDLAHFQKAGGLPVEAENIKHPIIGYIGTIQERLDYDLLRFLAEKNPDKSILMVGPVWQGARQEIKEKLSSLRNVYFLGRKSYLESPSYIKQFDVAIIPHKIDDFVMSTNPMKMYEYLACGKPVVSTPGAGVEMFSDFVSVASTPQKFNQKIQEAIDSDNQAKRQARISAIQRHSWQSRVNQMLDIINQRV